VGDHPAINLTAHDPDALTVVWISDSVVVQHSPTAAHGL
jgi:hypothetical protein